MNANDDASRFHRIERPGARIQGEMVFFDPDAGKYYGTGPVGADIWDFLAEPRNFSEICAHLLDLYDIGAGDCEREVRAFLDQLAKAGLLAKAPR